MFDIVAYVMYGACIGLMYGYEVMFTITYCGCKCFNPYDTFRRIMV
jgi:hypothetical protein